MKNHYEWINRLLVIHIPFPFFDFLADVDWKNWVFVLQKWSQPVDTHGFWGTLNVLKIHKIRIKFETQMLFWLCLFVYYCLSMYSQLTAKTVVTGYDRSKHWNIGLTQWDCVSVRLHRIDVYSREWKGSYSALYYKRIHRRNVCFAKHGFE